MNKNGRFGFFKLPASYNNLDHTERVKIAFQFTLMSVCSLILGVLLSRSLSEVFYSDYVVNISTHFETLFLKCEKFYDYFLCVASYAISDIVCVIIIFCVSFAAFNYVVSDLVLAYLGIKTGLAVSFLFTFISNPEFQYNIGWLKYMVFLIFKLFILIIIWDYSYRSAVYSYNLKKVNTLGRSATSAKTLFVFLINTAAYLGSVIILNILYCLLVYLLK